MQFNGLIIAQTNINQEFGLAKDAPTKHWEDLLQFRIVFKGSSKLPCKIASTTKSFSWKCPLVRPSSHGSQSSHRTDPQNLKVTILHPSNQHEHQQSGML